MRAWLRPLLPLLRWLKSFGIDPYQGYLGVCAFFGHYLRNIQIYRRLRQNNQAFPITWRDALFTSTDRFGKAAATASHYFWQDLWAADYIYRLGIRQHVDVASRVDGFVAHLLPFCEVTYIDLRPLPAVWPTLRFMQGSILALPFPDASLSSMSCLHVLEHIGLGRYGDPVEPEAYRRAAAELRRVLAPGGAFLFSTPVGRERLCFDAHRVFDPATIESIFTPLRLQEFHLIPDRADRIIMHADFAEARRGEYGCGLFVFRRVN
jgi:SAM-dependent methyltransferase